MILDNIKNIDKYSFSSPLLKGFDFLLKNDLENLPEGKYEIAEGIFANVQKIQAKAPDLRKFEAHKDYIDIQYIISGKERMDFSNIENFKVEIPYDKEKDVEFLKLNSEEITPNSAYLKEGDFIIFYPQDAHAPMLKALDTDYEIKKVIVKISTKL